jgi:class 3 adenylate cyclase
LVGDVFDSDMNAVLDTIACRRVALFGWGYSTANALHFSVTHPERVDALVLFNSYAHYVRDDDYPYGLAAEDVDDFMERFQEGWGTGSTFELLAPGRVADDRFRSWWVRSARLQLGSDEVVEILRATMALDLRPFLTMITVPTLVLHREGNKYIEMGAGRYLAQHIPGANFVVLPGGDHHYFVGDLDGLADEIEEFLTGARSGIEADTLTATVLFTDIVASTEEQVRLGHREWSRLTDQHDAMVRGVLARHRGNEVKTTGDGFVITFDAAGRGLRCATEIVARAKDLGLELRAGLHCGDMEIRGDDIGGVSVNIAKRLCDLACPSEVLASDTIRLGMLGSGVQFTDRGEYNLKGVPGTWRLFAVTADSF